MCEGAWPYPCPRPLFRTSWMLRTASMTSIHAVAMQLRILWMCVKWDDMSTKPPALYDGKNQVTTDTEIVTTEIRKHRNIGRYSEITQYWQRKISIPLDAPRKQVDYSPIRSGLRKRKRAESPVSADPRVEEVWVEEMSLELWEIKAYRDRLDRDRERLTTRRQAGIITKAPERLDPSEDRKTRIFNQNLQEIKQRTEESLRQQREAYKAGRNVTPDKQLLSSGGYIKTVGNQGIKLIASKGSEAGNPAKKIFITKDGKIIGHQLAPPGKVAIPNLANKVVGGATPPVGAAQSPVQQKVQIVKSADGKIQVRGLLPGQQLVQMPDGRLQIFSSNSPNVSGGTPVKSSETVIQTASPQTPTIQPQQLLPKPSPVQSPSKTYTIQRNPNIMRGPSLNPTTPIQPRPIQPAAGPVTPAASVTPATPSTLATPPTPATPIAAPGAAKQKVVGIQSLGNNTVTIKDGQLIVQGPDHEAATGIAKKLASGEAKLGNVNGKQVLVMLGQEETPAPAPAPAPAPPPKAPTPPAPAVKPVTTLSSITVTAQLVQTGQGPRIILQGLQGVQLEPQQLTQIQQQVKTQLLKQQSLARQEGKVPPTKVSITLTGNFNKAPAEQQQQTTHPPKPGGNQPVNSLDPPQLQVQSQQVVQQSQQPQQQQQNNFLSQPPQVNSNPQQQPESSTNTTPVAKIASQQTIMANLPQSVIKQGQFIIKDGKKVLVLPQNVLAAHQARQKQLLQQQSSQPPPHPPPHPQSILLNSLTSPSKPSLTAKTEDGDKFELTDDYIQQTIKNALNSGNLTLEQQEKLINQLDGSDMTDLSRVSRAKKGKRGKTGAIDPASGELMDDEWQPEPNQRSAVRIQPQTVARRRPEPEPQVSPDITTQQPHVKSPPVRSIKKMSPVDEKKRQAVQNRLSSMLFKQKEQLKRDIAKKRALLEKELSVEISAEVESLKQQAQLKLNSQIGKRSYSEMTSPPQSSPLAKRRRKSDNSELFNTHGIKRDRLYCVCKTKYDPTK